jgi:IMP dehydrogenase
MSNGYCVSELFSCKDDLTYDDISVLPGIITDTDTSSNISLETQLSRRIKLKIPIVSVSIDTVFKADMAIAIASQGGIGIIDCNNDPNEQADEVRKVKRYRNCMIDTPIVFGKNSTIKEFRDSLSKFPFSGFPITESGLLGSKLVGFISREHVDRLSNISVMDKLTIDKIMTPINKLVFGTQDSSIEDHYQKIVDYDISRLPIVDNLVNKNLIGLVCRKDLNHCRSFPKASLDGYGQLLVGASVLSQKDFELRVDLLAKAGVDILMVDSVLGVSISQRNVIKYIKENYPFIDVIAGNVVSVKQAKYLIESGVDALRLGSIYTTQDVCGVGRSNGSALYHVSNYAKSRDIPVIACENISCEGSLIGDSSSNIMKALALGAHTVMVKSLVLTTELSDKNQFLVDEKTVKIYMDMMIDCAHKNIPCLISCLVKGLHNIGEHATSIENLHNSVEDGKITFVKRIVKH